jgi:hypothetical protein
VEPRLRGRGWGGIPHISAGGHACAWRGENWMRA